MRSSATLAIVALAALLASCTASGGAASASPGGSSAAPTAVPTPSVTPAPSGDDPTPPASADPSAQGYWLRAWYTQALPPLNVFGMTDAVVITHDGIAVVSTPVPAIFPGPAVIPLGGRQLTRAGLDKIVATAKELGLLGATKDFGAPSMPGAAVAHIALIVDGKPVEITGDANATIECVKAPCNPPAGSPAAFGELWRDLANLDWLGADAAAQQPYAPPVYSVLVGQAPKPDANLGANIVVWPLATPIASFGTSVANGTARCGTLAGVDADRLRAALAKADSLTQCVQNPTTNATFGLTVRPLVDGQDVCRDVFGVG